ncbi:cystathionine beta-lyase [Sphingomonas sp. HDW15A]|uniref:cystathionine beta-lyase n=1 Tax=Sphingomonas sp. HDW15A TaxID=2714942 RepID=UPI00140B2A4E|nr:cystathionine beta-lyase [Sphingomonas sp. HDW15A]QIK95981.1 cystathionine beta-lyase [Sphingomonas sp. HDW15A]
MSHEGDGKALSTRLIHAEKPDGKSFVSLAVPTYRGSTVVFPTLEDLDHPREGQYRYGLHGSPTHRALTDRLAEIEGARHVQLAPSGLAAIALTFLSFLRSGNHLLVPKSSYGPTVDLANGLLADLGVETELYDPMVGGNIASLIRDNTALVWSESPGSISMEFQDVPAISAAARAKGVPVAIDNTYGAGVLFDAFAAGCDVSVQALTKYQAGHSDVLMGSVATRDEQLGKKIQRAAMLLGFGVSPDDCSLVLRGLKTFELRLRHLGESTLKVAAWLSRREEVTAVLHPAFSDCPGHDVWKRDWTGSASLFSVIFGSWSRQQVVTFVEALKLFGIGFSWGGANSLAITYHDLDRPSAELGPLLVRLNIGLEDPADLIADLEQALAQASSL